jgi:hypothetical protein
MHQVLGGAGIVGFDSTDSGSTGASALCRGVDIRADFVLPDGVGEKQSFARVDPDWDSKKRVKTLAKLAESCSVDELLEA